MSEDVDPTKVNNSRRVNKFEIFSQGIAPYGPVILKNGVVMSCDDIVHHLNELTDNLAFYSDATTYHAIAFIPDHPCGEFIDDFSENTDYDYPKPGYRARATFTELDIESE